MEKGFWDLRHCSKLDILDERIHARVIGEVLEDPITEIEVIRPGTFSLIGPEEALLISPDEPHLLMTFMLYAMVCSN